MTRVTRLTACDLEQEAQAIEAAGEIVERWRTGPHNAQATEILWLPSRGRAGVAAGGDADWTDAYSAADALERYEAGTMVE